MKINSNNLFTIILTVLFSLFICGCNSNKASGTHDNSGTQIVQEVDTNTPFLDIDSSDDDFESEPWDGYDDDAENDFDSEKDRDSYILSEGEKFYFTITYDTSSTVIEGYGVPGGLELSENGVLYYPITGKYTVTRHYVDVETGEEKVGIDNKDLNTEALIYSDHYDIRFPAVYEGRICFERLPLTGGRTRGNEYNGDSYTFVTGYFHK